jgi:secreted trypsin-like serine protease
MLIGNGIPVNEKVYRQTFSSVVALVVADQMPSVGASKPSCTGTKIGDGLILTAAHCFDNGKISARSVWVGSDWFDTTDKRMRFSNAAWLCEHPSYKGMPRTGYDVAILRVCDNVERSVPARPADIGEKKENLLRIAGWGPSGSPNSTCGSAVMCYGIVNHVRTEECIAGFEAKRYPLENTQSMLCVHGQKQNLCGGDSGGPAYDQNGVQIGVASLRLKDCGARSSYNVYADTRHQEIAEWIQQAQIANASPGDHLLCRGNGSEPKLVKMSDELSCAE